MKQRGFEIISKYQEEGLSVPQRATKGAAGMIFKQPKRSLYQVFGSYNKLEKIPNQF